MAKTLALICAFGACLCQSGLALGNAETLQSDLERSCDAHGCHDELALIQQVVKRHDSHALGNKQWPDLGKLADQAQDIIGQATDAVSDVAAGAIATVGKTINTTLTTLEDKVAKYAAEVNASADGIRLGMASLLSKAFNVSVPDLPSGSEYEKVVTDKINSAVVMFDSVVTSIEGAVAVVTNTPLGLGDLTESLNATLQSALSHCKDFASSLKDVQALIKDPSAAESSLLQVRADPKETVTKLDQTLKAALQQVSGFAESFGDAFAQVSDAVVSAAKDNVGESGLAQISAAFDGVTATAHAVAEQATAAFDQLFGSISEGVAAVGIAPEGSGAGAAAASWLLVAALAAVACGV